MHDFGEIITTIGVAVSLARFILEFIKYINGHKKK